jgi:UDP-N-acetylglucosamine pyrophosphorylase
MKYAIIGQGEYRGKVEDRYRVCNSLEETLKMISIFTEFEVYELNKSKTQEEWRKLSKQHYDSIRENEERREYESLKKKYG